MSSSTTNSSTENPADSAASSVRSRRVRVDGAAERHDEQRDGEQHHDQRLDRELGERQVGRAVHHERERCDEPGQARRRSWRPAATAPGRRRCRPRARPAPPPRARGAGRPSRRAAAAPLPPRPGPRPRTPWRRPARPTGSRAGHRAGRARPCPPRRPRRPEQCLVAMLRLVPIQGRPRCAVAGGWDPRTRRSACRWPPLRRSTPASASPVPQPEPSPPPARHRSRPPPAATPIG